MAIQLFGFQLGRVEKEQEKKEKNVRSPAPPPNDDAAVTVASGGQYGVYVDLTSSAKDDVQLVTKYREMAQHPEVDSAIDDIVNEAIVYDEKESPVSLNLDDVELSDNIKNKIQDEFDIILRLLDFNDKGYDIFQHWYVDARLYYHIMIDEMQPRKGIQELRYIDPRYIRKVREVQQNKNTNSTPVQGSATNNLDLTYSEYFLYSPSGIKKDTTQGIKIAEDAICFVHSGIMDTMNKMILSHLHKAIKPLNQLRMLEDATVIYRIARAPERRIFYIDVGNLPKLKAEQYLRDMMVKHKNKLVYNASTGEVRDDRRFMTMLEDFWFPRREGQGTQVDTLQGGQNLGEIEDVEYFRRKLYKSLNVPVSRLETEAGFNLGRSSEITRDELKFSKFIARLRSRFSQLFIRLLGVQLVLKGVMSLAEYEEHSQNMFIDFLKDNHFTELKDTEILSTRLDILSSIDQYVGVYFSKDWVRRNVLRQSDEDIDEIDKQIKKEGSDEQGFGDDKAFNGGDSDPESSFPDVYGQGGIEKEPKKEPKNEKFVPSKTRTKDEKKLVEQLTKFNDSDSVIDVNNLIQLPESDSIDPLDIEYYSEQNPTENE